MARPELIFREAIPHNTTPAWPAQVHRYGSGVLRFSIEATGAWQPHVDVLPGNVPELVRALAADLGWDVVERSDPAVMHPNDIGMGETK